MATTTQARALDEEYVAFVREAWADPRPFYDRLRAEAPVYWTPLDHWFVSDFENADAMYKDNAHWSQRPVLQTPQAFDLGDGPTARFYAETILSLDGDAHQRLRAPVSTVFTPRGMDALKGTVRQTVADLLEQASTGSSMDFLTAFAKPLPTSVILDIFAIERQEYDRFIEVADIIIECYEAMGTGHFKPDLRQRADRAFAECAAYVIELADSRRGGSGDDLLSQLVRVQDAEPASFSNSELAALLMFLVTAGFETTMYTAANMLYHLLRNPDQLQLVRDDRTLIPSVVEEILRYEPGVYISSVRFATEDMKIAGQQIRRGDKCLISNHAANHDPAIFSEPHRFDVTRSANRKVNRQIGFGRGRHTCLGAPLARLELNLALEAILDRFPRLELATDEIQWTSSHVLRGPTTLPIRW